MQSSPRPGSMPLAVTLKWLRCRWELTGFSQQRLERLIVREIFEPIMQPDLLKLQSKDTAVILSDLTHAVRAIPGCSLCYLALSKVHEKTGEQKSALDDLGKAITLDPNFAEAWYRLSVFYNQLGLRAEAEQARRRFEGLKEHKANRETDMLRNIFLNALGGETSTHDSHRDP